MATEKSICRNCGAEITDLADAMVHGCSNCGSRKFTFITENPNADEEQEETVEVELEDDSIADEVAIKVQKSGKYLINLENLLKRQGTNDPIMVEDQAGVVRIILNPGNDEK